MTIYFDGLKYRDNVSTKHQSISKTKKVVKKPVHFHNTNKGTSEKKEKN